MSKIGLGRQYDVIPVYIRIWKEDLKSSRTPNIMSARNQLRADQN